MSFCCEGVLGYGVNTHEEEPTTVLPPTNSDALFASLFVKHGDLPHTLFDELLSVLRYLDFSSKDVTLTVESTADEENYLLVEDWGQSTISDALLAWLLESNGSYQPISFSRNLLSLLQHHEFDSDDVTMKNTEVILDHIEGRLRLVAFEKKIDHWVQSGDRVDITVPTLVVELVAEELESQRRPFQSILRTSLLFSEADKTLRDMCLVHSSWTSAARPPFRRRICVDEKGLRSLLRSPHLGPWVRELAYRPCFSLRSDYDGISPHLQLEEPSRLLCRIVKRCPNITQLHLQDLYPYTEATTDDNPITEGFLPPLRDMQYLTHLWLHSPYEGYSINLWDLCMVLPQLQSLKTLSLECVGARYTVRGRYDASKLIEESSPSHTLKSLSLMHMYTYDKGPLKWLTHPRAGYTLNKLEVKYFVGSSLNYNHKFKEQLNYLSPASHPHIEELRVIDFRGESDFASAIETLTSLRTLSLSMHRFKTLPADPPLELPVSVRDLHIRLLGDPMNSKHASAIRALLVASLHLRRLSLTFTLIVREPLDGQKPVVRTLDAAEIKIVFANVIQHCSENNICFVSDVEEPIYDYLDSDLHV